MSDIAIRVENLSKHYRIGDRQQQYTSLRELVAGQARRLTRRTSRDAEAREFWALRDVSFEVKRGDIVGVIGRNGAGKSTLLKILSRITEPTEGSVELHGRVGSLLEVGTGFHPELTGRENIFLNGAILGMKRAEIQRRFDEIVDFSEIERFLDTPVKHYSSGMYVRLAFAVAAHLDTDILLVDEVLAVGDIQFQRKCLGKMDDIARAGRTVLFVSHNMGAISQLTESAILFDHGRVGALGPVDSVVAQYLSSAFRHGVKSLDELRADGDYGRRVRFTEIRLISMTGPDLRFGAPIKYQLHVHAESLEDDLSIGSSIYDASGACVGSLITRETFSVAPGEHLELHLCINGLHLAPGPYFAGFSIGRGGISGQRHELEIVIGAPSFQILPLTTGDNVIGNWNPVWGRIVLTENKLEICHVNNEMS